ncbi:hypothetical protein BAUCODRAFT_305787 [Baudoinia panamericana UAMH 10762]|uniref:SET domain-containing protein n=1 Tax=Baudoinia panamericana (strain UAMH 10762) TaxID=717646 RepID=M2MZQ1_BAUPA|nr:uncharacterized protein BAUCODRAFT_305787 [Baudoinia panamericana UAMH 10762]EMC91815.1 hypothetical protein BAUCODRAFT_305787 [Baudoinia panamericana UAMH 10762]
MSRLRAESAPVSLRSVFTDCDTHSTTRRSSDVSLSAGRLSPNSAASSDHEAKVTTQATTESSTVHPVETSQPPVCAASPPSCLNHIYFFTRDVPDIAPPANVKDQRSASPASRDESTSSSGSLNPLAPTFTPSFPSPTASRLYELREVPGKGLGLFAATNIPLGARIICESPLLTISRNELHLVWGPYCRLSNAQKKAYDSLHFYNPPFMKLEQAGRLQLIDTNDTSLDADDIDEIVRDHVRVMGIFATNNFISGPAFAVYEEASRLNHSCIPNVHHSYNPTLKKLTVHAARDIYAGEELLTNYVGGRFTYWPRKRRQGILRQQYGFQCACVACVDRTGQSDGRREVMANMAYGLMQYGGDRHGEGQNPYIPATVDAALRQSEDLITLLLEEGITNIELCKAYRTAAQEALKMQDYTKARDYALNEAEVELNCLGAEVDDLVKCGSAASVFINLVEHEMVKAGAIEPAVTPRKTKKTKKTWSERRKVKREREAAAQKAEAARS